ncbi:MAG: DsbA family protein [Actinomycetota bacterium]|nr:DsbA family protein [Actinomycetota bacterium]
MRAPARRTIAIWSDLACPWAHVAVARLHRVRDELGLANQVRFDHRVFPLELINEGPTARSTLDAEVAVVGALEPAAGWQVWQGRDSAYPVTTLPAMEAVQAVKEQSLGASEALDRELRAALFARSECISLRPVILDAASRTRAVDVDALADALDEGRARRTVMDDFEEATGGTVRGSPHVFLPDGTDSHNPGVEMHWEGEKGRGFPVVDSDRPDVYFDLLRAAAASRRAG